MNNQHDSVDVDGTARLSRIADRWWDRSGEFKPLHDINPLRLDYINGYAGLADKRVLDVGCGGGILSESMTKCGIEHVTDVDMAGRSPQTAAAHAASQHVANIDCRCIRVEDPAAEQPRNFGVVTYIEMMEHVPGPAAIIQAYAKLTKLDDTVFFSTINRNPKSYLHLIVGAEYPLKFAPRGTHDWKKFITSAELARMCRQAGLDITGSKGITYNLLSGRYSLYGSTEVSYIVACRPA